MTDTFSSKKRSQIMAKVKSSETNPELIVRKFLFSQGFRYRKNVKFLPGKPDIVLPKFKVCIFIHGCFWHGHTKCKDAKLPKSRLDYWKPKIQGNIKRDNENKNELEKLGWKVIEVWTCQLSNKTGCEMRFMELLKELNYYK